MIEIIQQIYQQEMQTHLLLYTTLFIWSVFAAISILHFIWLVIDDAIHEPWFPRIFLCWFFSLFSERSYQRWMIDYDCDRRDTGFTIGFFGLMLLVVGIPFAILAFPLTITLILGYTITVGLRSVRRIQKRIDNVPQEE